MYTLVAHNKSLWPLNLLSVCKHAYLVKIISLFILGQILVNI